MNIEKLKEVLPGFIYVQLPIVIEKFGINTPFRMAHFLGQCHHESDRFKSLSENLNYSSDGLLKTFKKYFTPSTATQYARKAPAIANLVYANRMGNGNEASGDGYKFRGRGAIQLTGKANYDAFGKSIGVDLISNPDPVATSYALISAAWFFKNCLSLCDKGINDEIITQVSKKVNGGTIGLYDRITQAKKYYTYIQ